MTRHGKRRSREGIIQYKHNTESSRTRGKNYMDEPLDAWDCLLTLSVTLVLTWTDAMWLVSSNVAYPHLLHRR